MLVSHRLFTCRRVAGLHFGASSPPLPAALLLLRATCAVPYLSFFLCCWRGGGFLFFRVAAPSRRWATTSAFFYGQHRPLPHLAGCGCGFHATAALREFNVFFRTGGDGTVETGGRVTSATCHKVDTRRWTPACGTRDTGPSCLAPLWYAAVNKRRQRTCGRDLLISSPWRISAVPSLWCGTD